MSECIASDLLSWIECHPGTAGWVQAVGSIVALGIAIFVPYWMTKSADRLACRRLLESVAAIGAEAQECFANAAMHCGNDGEDAVSYIISVEAFHKFRVASAAMNAIPVCQLPTYELTRCVLELQRMMEEGMMQWQAASNEIGNHNGQLVQAKAYGTAFSALATRAHPFLKAIEKAAISKR